jgi:hypothetical protein
MLLFTLTDEEFSSMLTMSVFDQQMNEQRQRWLHVNNAVMLSLLTYCVLHSTEHRGLASIRLELALLLHESRCHVPANMKSLPPLLSAYMSHTTTVFADPVYYLRSLTGSLIGVAITEFPNPPTLMIPSKVATSSNLSVAGMNCVELCKMLSQQPAHVDA